MQPPPLLPERPPRTQAVLVIAGPVILGAICGWVLGVDKTAYTVLSVIAAIGGIAAGYEHLGARGGAVRGVIGGALFGAAILALSAITGAAPEVKLPDPRIVLVLVTALAGALLGALGGALRRRREKAAPPRGPRS